MATRRRETLLRQNVGISFPVSLFLHHLFFILLFLHSYSFHFYGIKHSLLDENKLYIHAYISPVWRVVSIGLDSTPPAILGNFVVVYSIH
jgi:hypothetical protein